MEHPEHFTDLVPKTAIPLFGFRVAAFYDAEGKLAYQMSVDQDGSSAIAFLIGVLEMCKGEITKYAIEKGSQE